MSLYHPHDLPFPLRERPESYSEMCHALGWKNAWESAEREENAAHIRPTVPCPSKFPPVPQGLVLPGLITEEELADETKTLLRLGYSLEEIEEAQKQQLPPGGAPAARAWLESWVARHKNKNDEADVQENDKKKRKVFWDLPCAGKAGPVEGFDEFQWTNLSEDKGWLRVSHYMAVGCISAREILERSAETPYYAGVAYRLLWREFHRLYALKYHRKIAWLQGPAKVERPWSQDPVISEAWKMGKTGVPYIDACQRELNTTGWLAYKGRKTAAFFLVHSLGMDWRIGAFHDEETLLDYDFAMNYGNWGVVSKIGNGGASAWAGSTDVDPEHTDLKWKLHAEQVNDPTGEYIRRWVPELRNVVDKHIHTPWTMTDAEMREAKCVIGTDYPASLVGPLNLLELESWTNAESTTWESNEPSVAELKQRLLEKEMEVEQLK